MYKPLKTIFKKLINPNFSIETKNNQENKVMLKFTNFMLLISVIKNNSLS